MYKLVAMDVISTVGTDKLDTNQYQFTDIVEEADAILLRSTNIHELPVPETLKAVVRAGAGTNNIPIDKFTQLGIPVFNAPGANANSVKELVIAGMLLASRNINKALSFVDSMQSAEQSEMNKRMEASKKQFRGVELSGKTLAIVGLGAIGVKVANAAQAMGMRVIGYDPAIRVDSAWELSSTVSKESSLMQLAAKADYLSVHVPLNEHTKGLINQQLFKQLKPGCTLLNFAREQVVDELAVIDALENNMIKHYVTDFPSQQLKQYDNVIALPHLGASTVEAQEICAKMAVEQLIDYLEKGIIRNSVNFPTADLQKQPGSYRLAIVNRNVPQIVAKVSSVLGDNKLNIVELLNKSRGEIAYTLVDVGQKVTADIFDKINALDAVISLRVL